MSGRCFHGAWNSNVSGRTLGLSDRTLPAPIGHYRPAVLCQFTQSLPAVSDSLPAHDGREARGRWPQQWFRPGQPYLEYPSKANLLWLRESGIDLPDELVPERISDAQAEEICDAFGLFGTPEECLERLRRAEAESGIGHVFIFPTHTQEGGYDMPRAEVDAFQRVIIPGLGSD